jgi:HEAT repeat protein
MDRGNLWVASDPSGKLLTVVDWGAMEDLNAFLTYNLQRLKEAEYDDAYHSLIKADDAVIPLFIEAFRAEPHSATRASLVEIVWQHRAPETIDFLSEALDDNHPEVWKSALDGFVALGSPAAIQVLESVKHRVPTGSQAKSGRLDWIDEAIQRIRDG